MGDSGTDTGVIATSLGVKLPSFRGRREQDKSRVCDSESKSASGDAA
jgi:hypothetical protein